MITSAISHYNSSTLKSASYNYEKKSLLIHFNGASYLYKEVDTEDWHLFNTADSQGMALNQYIKGKYEFEKINEEPELMIGGKL